MPTYEVKDGLLHIKVPVDAIAANVPQHYVVKDKVGLALAVGRELCDCEDMGEQFYISDTLDDALGRVLDGADESIDFRDE